VSYRVIAEWYPTGWWVVTVPDVPGAVTQCRRLDQVAGDAAEVIEIQTGETVDPADLSIEPRLPGEAGRVADEARRLRQEADELRRRTEERTLAAAQLLKAQGFTVRDIGQLSGVSFHRVQQLLGGGRSALARPVRHTARSA
jgi:predicted RNase H-like HicB family nuclease